MTDCANIHTSPSPVDINAEFGRILHNPSSYQANGQKTWSSPRPRRRGWIWGRHLTIKGFGTVRDENEETHGPPPPPTRRKSVKNMFFSVRNGLFQSPFPTENRSQDVESSRQEEDSIPVAVHTEVVVHDPDEKYDRQNLRRSKSLSFLESLSHTISSKRNSKQHSGLLRVYPGLDKLEYSRETYDEGISLWQNDYHDAGTSHHCKGNAGLVEAKDQKLSQFLEPGRIENTEFQMKEEVLDSTLLQQVKEQTSAELGQTNIEYMWEDPQCFGIDYSIEECSQRCYAPSERSITRGATPDSYLELLIESLCPPSDTSSICEGGHGDSKHHSQLHDDQPGFLLPTAVEEMQIHCQTAREEEVASIRRSLERCSINVPDLAYYLEGSEGDQHYCKDQPTSVPVCEVNPSSYIGIADSDHYFRQFQRESIAGVGPQTCEQTIQETIEMRIKRTVAVMRKNFPASSDSDTDSTPSSVFSLSPKRKPQNDSEATDPTSLSSFGAGSEKEPHRQEIVKDGERSLVSPTNSGNDSAISWGAHGKTNAIVDHVEKSLKKRQNTGKSPRSTSTLPKYHTVKETVRQNMRNMKFRGFEFEQRTLDAEPLSSWGKTTLQRSNMTLGPVQVNFPQTANSGGHTELYDTRSEAITEIYRKNHGDYDSMCTFDPTIRVIFVHEMGKFVPNYVEIERLGLEILFLRADYDEEQCPQPSSSSSLHSKENINDDRRVSMTNGYQSAANLSNQNFSFGKDEASSHANGDSAFNNLVLDPFDMVNIQPPNSPVSSMKSDAEGNGWERDASVFGDDFFLDDPTTWRSWLGSQISGSASDISHSETVQTEETYSVPMKSSNDAPPQSPHTWGSKTWPSLGREYISMVESTIPKIHIVEADNTSERLPNRMGLSRSKEFVDGKTEHSTIPTHSGKVAQRDGSMDEDFTIELQEAENRSLQQVIDQIVSMRGDTLDRGIALVSDSSNHRAKIEDKGTEVFNVKEWTKRIADVGQQDYVPREMSSIDDKFDDTEQLVSKSEADKQDFRVFSYPLRYSSPFQPHTKDQAHHLDGKRKKSHRNVSGGSNLSNSSGFKFTNYLNELSEIASNGSTIGIPGPTKYDISEISYRGLGSVERCKVPVDQNGSPRGITAEDLNLRFVGRPAQGSKLVKQEARGCALVGLFQSHGLMPQSQPMLRSPTTLGSSPFNNTTTSRVPSVNFSPVAMAQGEDVEAESEKTANTAAFKRAFSGLSGDSTDVSSGFGEPLETCPGRDNPFWEY